jgi:tricin synthase
MAAASDRGGGEVKNIHSKESTKTLLKSEALYEVRSHLTCYMVDRSWMSSLLLMRCLFLPVHAQHDGVPAGA